MGNYRGYFRAYNDDTYEVQLIGDTASTAFTEVKLSGSNPFVVRYDDSKTIYEPVRTSKATISIVNNNYMEDILSPYAHGTRVTLLNTTHNTIEWVGFLTPKLYSQEYVREYEVIELEAEDCLSTLQYIPYVDDTAHTKSIVTIKSILNGINDACELTAGYYWSRTKKVGNTVLLPDQVKVSEYNFFTSDTDESWMLDEMLTEICKYFGFTCLQWKDRIYFADYQSYHNNNDIYCNWFSKASGYNNTSYAHVGSAKSVDEDSFMGSNATISFQPIYNKVVVNANMNTCEDFIPTPFEDEYLTNRNGDGEDGRPLNFYASYEVPAVEPFRPVYISGTKWFNQNYAEDCDVDDDAKRYGDAKYRYFHRLYDNRFWDSVYYNPDNFNMQNPVPISKQAMGDDYRDVSAVRDYVGATIMDLGCVRVPYVNGQKQTVYASKLDYTRYLCFCQLGKTTTEPEDLKNVIMFKLKDGYHAPCFMDIDKAYLVINFSIIWERYQNRPYINPDWNNNELKVGSGGVQNYDDGEIWFRFRIGDKYWNGTGWTTTNKIFEVKTEKTENEHGSWNDERNVNNTVTWDMYVNEEGYKLPLAGVDLTGDISFEIIMPTFQYRKMYHESSMNYSYNAYCWMKDLSIKCVQVGQDGEEQEENDVTYENVIDVDAVSELGDIKVKLTTSTDLTKPSYSHVIYYNGSTNTLLTAVKEDNIEDAVAQKPEENIIQKYVQQYSTSTKQFQMTLDTSFTPFDVVSNLDVDSPGKRFIPLSTEIDYKAQSQEIKYEEIK